MRFDGLLHEGWRALCDRALPEGGSKRYSSCGVPRVAPNAPKPDEAPSGMRGKEDDAMKAHQTYMRAEPPASETPVVQHKQFF